jgi:hypothetical protein
MPELYRLRSDISSSQPCVSLEWIVPVIPGAGPAGLADHDKPRLFEEEWRPRLSLEVQGEVLYSIRTENGNGCSGKAEIQAWLAISYLQL